MIYTHRISDIRFTGAARRNFSTLRELCGDATLGNVVLVTNMWGGVSREVGEGRENGLSDNFFRPALDKGARMVRHDDTIQSAHNIIRMIMKNHPVVLQIQRELVDEHKDITDTAAGKAVNRELNEQMRRYKAELEKAEERMVKALEKKDEETRQELEREKREMQEQIDRVRRDSEEMSTTYAAEKERTKTKMKDMEKKIKGLEDLLGYPVTIPIYK